MKLSFPNSITPSQFLTEYWQKKPLLMRAALPEYQCPLEPNELAGLACESEIESRIVIEKDGVRPWEARVGPFDEEEFATLPASHWTLLVQDVDKHLPEVAELLQPFRFIPDWRLDDIMISYAVDQGSVGPHIDDYDVFLVQAKGKRRWMIHTHEVSEDDYIPGLDLRLLPDFEAEYDWVMEPGDVLYLPPNVAHWGVAEGDDCMTCSVGFRTPTFKEMSAAWCDELVSRHVPGGRYRDGKLSVQKDNAEIRPDALQHVREKMDELLTTSEEHRNRWFGSFITEPKDHLQVIPIEHPLAPNQFSMTFESATVLERNGWSRIAFIRGESENDYLYINGDEYPVSKKLEGMIEWISENRLLPFRDAIEWLKEPDGEALLTRLFNDGHLLPPHHEE